MGCPNLASMVSIQRNGGVPRIVEYFRKENEGNYINKDGYVEKKYEEMIMARRQFTNLTRIS